LLKKNSIEKHRLNQTIDFKGDGQMKRHLVGGLALLAFLSCGSGSDVAPQQEGDTTQQSGGANATEANAASTKGKMPDDPFFTECMYPGAQMKDSLTMGNATSVWFKTSDDMTKVTDFYSDKFADGNNLVEAERAYFTKVNAAGIGTGSTVTKQPDGTVQIILKLEQPKPQ